MPADLDLPRLLGALGTHADRIPLGTPEGARRRARQRRARLVATAAAAVVLLVAGGFGAAVLRHRSPQPAQPNPRPTVTFTPVRAVGGVAMDLSADGPPFTHVSILDGVAYVVGAGPTSAARVGALDLASGAPAFPTIELDLMSVSDVVVRPAGVIVVGTVPGDASTGLIVVLDARTGTERWRRSTRLAGAYDSAVVVYDDSTMRVAALDWATGAELWSRGVDATLGLGAFSPPSPALPARHGEWGVDPSDDRLVAASSGGEVEVIDVRNGETLAHISMGEVYSITPVGEKLYATTAGAVWAYGLDGSVRRIRAGAGTEDFRVMPCWAGLVCLLSPADFSVYGIDAATGELRFQQRQNFVVSVVGDRMLVNDGELWDLNGHQLGEPAANGLVGQYQQAWWLTPGSVLRLRVTVPGPTDRLTVEGVDTGAGRRLDLGQIPLLADRTCAADRHYLVCPTTDGFQAWQFATG